MKRTKDFGYGNVKLYKYDDKYTSLVTVKCKCGHSVTIYNRQRRNFCSVCGRMVFLTKKDEFDYKMKRVMKYDSRTKTKSF